LEEGGMMEAEIMEEGEIMEAEAEIPDSLIRELSVCPIVF